MDDLTNRVQVLEAKIVAAVNESNLPPIVVDLLLNNLLKEVKEAERNAAPKMKEIQIDEISGDGNSDKQ